MAISFHFPFNALLHLSLQDGELLKLNDSTLTLAADPPSSDGVKRKELVWQHFLMS
jgi:hypothetical protein